MTRVSRAVQFELLRSHPAVVSEARVRPERRRQLELLLAQTLVRHEPPPSRSALAQSVQAHAAEMSGLGPLESLLSDPEVTEIMINGARRIYVERAGSLVVTPGGFRDDAHVMEVVSRILAPLGRRIDQASPTVDARLPDGSRLHAIIPPLSLLGPVVTIRRFPPRSLGLPELVASGVLSHELAALLADLVRVRANVLISGATGSGKTTLLAALCALVPPDQRIVTIEDSAEMRIDHPHVVPLEARPANAEGRGQINIRQLVRNALRMRPDRLVVGEVRGAEAFDMLQAMNTGHDGGMTTVHASSPAEALVRLENMVLMAGEGLPHAVVRQQLAMAVHLVVQLERTASGRRVSGMAAVSSDGAHSFEPGSVEALRRDLSSALPARLARGLGE